MAMPERPDPEVRERPRRRHYTAEYKQRVLAEADRATKPGEIGALLRREGLYSSRLSVWRQQRDRGALGAAPKPGGQRSQRDPRAAELTRLRKENNRLAMRLSQAQEVIAVQGKVSELLRRLSLESSETTPTA